MRDIFRWLPDEEVDGLRRVVVEAEAAAHPGRHLGADDGMVAFARLADVVIQERQHQQLRRVHFAQDRREPRVVEQALGVPHRQQRVLVDRVLVIEIARHPAGNLVQLGKHRAEQAAVAHLAEAGRQPGTRPHELQEAMLMFRRRVEHLGRVVVPLLLALDQRERIIGNGHVARHRGFERPQPFGRRGRRRRRVRERDAFDHPHQVLADQPNRRRRGRQRRAAHAPERARHAARVLEVVGHQRFDAPAHVARRRNEGDRPLSPAARSSAR